MHFHRPHPLNKAHQPIKQSININRGKIMKPAADLAPARSPRSSERSALAQPASSRLGKTTIEALGEFAGAR